MKLAIVTTPPSVRSEVGGSTHQLLPHLRERCDIDVFVAPGLECERDAGCVLRSTATLRPKSYDHIVYQLGNESAHAFMLPMVRALGGTVVQHAWALPDLTFAALPSLARRGARGALLALREGGIEAARSHFESAHDRADLALNRSIVRGGDSFLVHSRALKLRILEERNAATPIGIVFHGAERRWCDEDRKLVRARLDLTEAWRRGTLVAGLGALQSRESTCRLLEALERARCFDRELRLVLLGASDRDDVDALALVHERGLEDAVRIVRGSSEKEPFDWLHAADVCIGSFDQPSEIVRSLSLGRAVIASGSAGHDELHSAGVIEVEEGERAVETLAAHLVELSANPQKRAQLEAQARDFVERECHWSIVARKYVELLEDFPAPRSKHKSLLRAMVETSERHRRAEAARE